MMTVHFIQRRASNAVLVDDDRILDETLLEQAFVTVPFIHPVCVPLPDANGREQFSIREDSDVQIQQPQWDDCGWTVEYQAIVQCDWADFWVIPMLIQGLGIATVHPSGVRQLPAVNLLLDEALRVAKNFNDAQKRAERSLEGRSKGLVRLRHQHTGNIIYADILT